MAKKKGACSEFIQQRNTELLAAYKAELKKAQYQNLDFGFWKRVVDTPATRFWVSPERALEVMKLFLKGKNTIGKGRKSEMYLALFFALKEQIEKNPHLPLLHNVERAVFSPSPKMFLTPNSAKVIICQIKKEQRAKAWLR